MASNIIIDNLMSSCAFNNVQLFRLVSHSLIIGGVRPVRSTKCGPPSFVTLICDGPYLFPIFLIILNVPLMLFNIKHKY